MSTETDGRYIKTVVFYYSVTWTLFCALLISTLKCASAPDYNAIMSVRTSGGILTSNLPFRFAEYGVAVANNFAISMVTYVLAIFILYAAKERLSRNTFVVVNILFIAIASGFVYMCISEYVVVAKYG